MCSWFQHQREKKCFKEKKKKEREKGSLSHSMFTFLLFKTWDGGYCWKPSSLLPTPFLPAGFCLYFSYLVPRICSVWWVNENGDDLGFGKQGSHSSRSFLWVEVIGTLLKQKVSGDIRWDWEEIHIPRKGIFLKISFWFILILWWLKMFKGDSEICFLNKSLFL